MTTTLKIEHAIVSFETWQNAFERDPIGRERAGVRRYRVCRPADDPNYVMIDLDFDGHAQAEAFLEKLREVWQRVELSRDSSARARRVVAAPRREPVSSTRSRQRSIRELNHFAPVAGVSLRSLPPEPSVSR